MSPCGERKRSSSIIGEPSHGVTPDPQGVSCDNDKYWGSNYGNELDLVAPGIFIPTTDLQGSKGYNSANGNDGDYVPDFDGTSSACPHVSGVAALVLSVNSSLKSMEVKAIIESTAEKVREDLYTYTSNLYSHPNGSWNIEMGYGLVNAHRAVLKAFYHHIVGDDDINICDIKEYTLNNNSYTPSNATLLWTTSSNIEIIDGQESPNLEIKGIDIGNGWIECKISHLGETVILRKEINVFSTYPTFSDHNTYSSMVLSNNVVIKGNFIINSGHTVTIDNNIMVYCTPSAKFVVKCGGKLIVNGATLTSICSDGLWHGIEVQGNPHLPQDINNANQGIVILKNEAVIENAICGISAKQSIRIPHIIPGKESIINIGGGIIVANNTHFINNLQAVGMYAYMYREDPVNYWNISYFSNCEFEINKSGLHSDYQIYLEDVQGVIFNGCSFTNSNIGNGIGIYVNNAGVVLNPQIPDTYGLPYYPKACTFNGYHTALYIQNSVSKTTKIKNTEFSNNSIAIKAVASNTLYVKSCVFNVYCNNCSSFYGIVLENCNQYSVQNNRFYGNTDIGGIGLFISGKVENNNTIKYNDFTNLCIACNVNGRHGNGYENDNITGLQFLCNRYENNYTDIKVDDNGSIRYFQGDPIKAAGNEFYVQPLPSYMTTNIQNLGERFIYFYNQNNPLQLPFNYTNVSVVQTNADACMGYGFLGLFYYINFPIFYLSELENSFLMYETEYYQALIEYKNNYEGLSIEWPDFYEESFFDQPQVIDLMNLSYLKENMDMTCTHAVNILLSMEEMDKNQYHLWLSRSHTLFNSYVLAESYLSDGNIPEMEMILNAIPIDYPECDMDEYRDYLVCSRYLSYWRSIDPETGSITISEGAIDTLENIAASSPNMATVYAKSILESLGKEVTYTEMPNICDCMPGFVEEQNENNTQIQNRLITKPDIIIHPNPANDKVEIEVINSSYGIRKLMIYDVYGKIVWQKSVEAKDLLLLDINELSKGLYFIYCELENKQTIIKKLVKN